MTPKILYIIHLPPPVHGAAIVGETIKESKTINTALQGRYINLSTSKTLDEIGKGGIVKWIRYFKIVSQTIKQLLFFRPDLVYITLTAKGVGFYKDAVIALLVKAFGKKVVYHFHNKGVSTRQNRKLDNWLYQRVLKQANIILLASKLYEDINKYVSRERVFICPNGIDENLIPIAKKEVHEVVHFLFLSNLIESKGVKVLLDACEILQMKGISFVCHFVGKDGDLNASELNKMIQKRKLSDKVEYLGPKYGTEKASILNQTDIFIFPTYYSNECFPLVLLEAMQYSLPIVSTFEGGIPDIIRDGENGFLVPQKDALALAEKMEILIKDKKTREEMGARGYEHFKNNFTLSIFENRFVKIIKEIIMIR